MKTKNIVKLISIILVLAMLLMSGCASNDTSGSSESSESSTSLTSSSDEEKILMIGAALPLTGQLSPEGEKHQHGYDLWKNQVNEQGGINIGGETYKVEIKYYDYQSDTSIAVQLVERAITEDKVHAIFGPFGSGAAGAVAPVTERYGIPMIAPSASSRQIYMDGDKIFEYTFGTFTPNDTLTEPLTEIAVALDDPPKTIAILARNDLFPLAIGKEAQISAEKRGIDVIYFDEFPVGATDFSVALTEIRSLNPDWLFVTGYVENLILVKRQMKELDVQAKMVTMIAGAVYKEFIDGLGADANGVTTAAWWANSVDYDGEDIFGTALAYTELYEETYGYIPDYVCASSSAVGVIFQRAFEEAGTTDPAAVRDALANLDFISFWGPIKFDEVGMLELLDPPVLQIQDQQHKVLFPEIIKDADLIYPMQ